MGSYIDRILDCYIYLHHTDEFFILPQYPESITDYLQSSFAEQNALARTAPVYAYSNSGPRSVTVSLNLHRDMLNDVNANNSSIKKTDLTNSPILSDTDDYVDLLLKKLQAIALPEYDTTSKDVDPPRVTIRFGDDIFIEGVVRGGITLNYKLPLLEIKGQKKYAQADVSFTVSETTPYDATSVGNLGSFRDLTSTKSIITR